MYELSVATGAGQHHQATADTGDETLEVLRDHLTRHLPAGPVSWTITSPWGAQHLGMINLNGNTGAVDDYLTRTLRGEYSIRESLAREFYHQHQLSGHPIE
jgi:hypothetical protein